MKMYLVLSVLGLLVACGGEDKSTEDRADGSIEAVEKKCEGIYYIIVTETSPGSSPGSPCSGYNSCYTLPLPIAEIVIQQGADDMLTVRLPTSCTLSPTDLDMFLLLSGTCVDNGEDIHLESAEITLIDFGICNDSSESCDAPYKRTIDMHIKEDGTLEGIDVSTIDMSNIRQTEPAYPPCGTTASFVGYKY